jgi:hypothetical protein
MTTTAHQTSVTEITGPGFTMVPSCTCGWTSGAWTFDGALMVAYGHSPVRSVVVMLDRSPYLACHKPIGE